MTQNGPMGQCFMEANGLLAEVTVGQRNRGRLSLWCQIRWVLPSSDGLDAVGGGGDPRIRLPLYTSLSIRLVLGRLGLALTTPMMCGFISLHCCCSRVRRWRCGEVDAMGFGVGFSNISGGFPNTLSGGIVRFCLFLASVLGQLPYLQRALRVCGGGPGGKLQWSPSGVRCAAHGATVAVDRTASFCPFQVYVVADSGIGI